MTPAARIDATSRRRSTGERFDGRFGSTSRLRGLMFDTYAVGDGGVEKRALHAPPGAAIAIRSDLG